MTSEIDHFVSRLQKWIPPPGQRLNTFDAWILVDGHLRKITLWKDDACLKNLNETLWGDVEKDRWDVFDMDNLILEKFERRVYMISNKNGLDPMNLAATRICIDQMKLDPSSTMSANWDEMDEMPRGPVLLIQTLKHVPFSYDVRQLTHDWHQFFRSATPSIRYLCGAGKYINALKYLIANLDSAHETLVRDYLMEEYQNSPTQRERVRCMLLGAALIQCVGEQIWNSLNQIRAYKLWV